MKKYHDDPITGGHAGSRRLTEKIKQTYYWKFMSKDIAKYVKSCITCKKNKTHVHTREKLTITNTPQKAFDVVVIDTIGPFVKSDNGYEYAITIICDLTKYLVTVPITNKSAKSVATAIFENFILIYGPMKKIITDMGTEYKNETMNELCKLMKIKYVTSTAHHHQTVGTVERSHRTFNEYVRSYLSNNKTDWDVWLSYFTYCFNTTPSTVHGYCPFELIFGKNQTNFEFLLNDTVDPIYNVEAYDKEVKYRLQVSNQRAKSIIEKYKQQQKRFYDTKTNPISIKIDDLVLLKNDAGHKLDSLYRGPYLVKEIGM